MRPAPLLALAASLLIGATIPAALAKDDPPCPAVKIPPLVLPRLKQASASNHEVTIVALGSSSTEGWHASDIAHSYPAVLQSLLSAALPHGQVAVINRGAGGEDVLEEVPRLERDVIGVHPAVAIWQVGANGAMKNIPLELFKRMLTTGVQRLTQAHIDVVLMDNQRAPAILASPEHVKIDQAMAEVAVATGAVLFRRGALMDQWQDDGFPYGQFVSDDGLHHNDHGYRCVAQALSQGIVDGMGPATSTVAARH